MPLVPLSSSNSRSKHPPNSRTGTHSSKLAYPPHLRRHRGRRGHSKAGQEQPQISSGVCALQCMRAQLCQEQAWDAVVKRDPLRCALTASNTCCLTGEADGVLDLCCLCFISQTALCCVCRGSRSADYSPHSQPAHNLLHKAAVSTQLALLCGLQAG